MNIAEMTPKISYKPGWGFSYASNSLYEKLLIRAQVQDSRDPCKTVQFMMERAIPSFLMREQQDFVKWVKLILLEAEYHELREFLRYDGDLVDDPHEAVPAEPGGSDAQS